MMFSGLILPALAALPTAFAIPGPIGLPSWEPDRSSTSKTITRESPNTLFYPNISKTYDLLNRGSRFRQFCSTSGSSFINDIDQRTMLHGFNFGSNLADKTCSLYFEATGITLYYNSSFPIKFQLFSTMPDTPLPCGEDYLNNQRDKHLADITIYSSNGDHQWTNYTKDFLIHPSDCPTKGMQGYEVVMTGENQYAAWTLPTMGLMMMVQDK